MRSNVCANEKALVRTLVLVKKKSQTRSITPDTASEAIAAGDNCPNASRSTICPPAPKRTCSFIRTQTRHPMPRTSASGLTPRAFQDQTHPMRSYGPEEMAAHTAVMDNDPWTINDNLEHRFTAEIVTRTGIAHEELVLHPAGNNQWMRACRVDGQVSKCQQPDSAWPRDQNGEPTF